MRALPLIGSAPPGSASTTPLLAKGFRPFFLLAAIYAVLAVPTWVLALLGFARVGSSLVDPVTWHAHEMIFGFAGAVIAGFLLTAVGNWTQRETATGRWLAALAALWIGGRLAMATGAGLPSWLVAGIDLAFLPALAVAIGRPIVQAKNRRNYGVLAMVLVMAGANALVILRADRRWLLVGVDVVTFFMVVVTGRVVPMFTRNATKSDAVRSHPRLDVAATLAVLAVLVGDALAAPIPTRIACAVAAVLIGARALHWGARVSLREPLLWILHVGHAWIPLGLALRAASLQSAGIHALTAGAIGALTLGMMARVALGHTGRPLAVPPGMVTAFVLVTLAAVARVGVPIVAPGLYLRALEATAVLWSLAFGLYVTRYAPILWSPRIDGKPG